MVGANIAVAVVGGVLTVLYDRAKERRLARETLRPKIEPRPFSARQVAAFARPAPGGRWMMFDPDVANKILAVLANRSVQPIPIDAGPLGESFRAWEVVPRQAGLFGAGELVAQYHMIGGAVLASHEMVFVGLPEKAAARILVCGGPELRMLAAPGRGHFVELARPEIVTAPTEPPVVEASAPSPFAPPAASAREQESPAPETPKAPIDPDTPAIPPPPPDSRPSPEPVVPGDEPTADPAPAADEPVVPASAKSNGASQKAVLGSVLGKKVKGAEI